MIDEVHLLYKMSLLRLEEVAVLSIVQKSAQRVKEKKRK